MAADIPSSPDTKQNPPSEEYRDFSNETEQESQAILNSTKNCYHSEAIFPVKLHYMLSDMEADGLAHIVSWQPHGRCFIVHKPKEFGETILPLWFRQTKYSSFQRQLNLYGFKRITAGPDKGSHYHELFLRGKRHLAHRIPRVRIKGKGARKPADPRQEPDFYAKTFLPQTESKPPSSTLSTATTLKHMPQIANYPMVPYPPQGTMPPHQGVPFMMALGFTPGIHPCFPVYSYPTVIPPATADTTTSSATTPPMTGPTIYVFPPGSLAGYVHPMGVPFARLGSLPPSPSRR
eukprot:scaffold34619_cov183-Amphora_coffeaeformis.AAC.9